MRNKSRWNRCKKLFGFALLAFTLLGSPITTINVDAATGEETVAPCADVIEWKYKIENNKIYKRLYNSTTGEWLTDWIYVNDVS